MPGFRQAFSISPRPGILKGFAAEGIFFASEIQAIEPAYGKGGAGTSISNFDPLQYEQCFAHLFTLL